jgi:CDP-glucose 4,6-dehydratase
MLRHLGATVRGFSLTSTGEQHAHFNALVQNAEPSELGDIRVLQRFHAAIRDSEPDFIFHLAAQPLVRESLENPLVTWDTNLIGTLNLLDYLRMESSDVKAIFVTSDKVYENMEWHWPYRENDRLGGKDPYSASKASAEIAISSYVRSFFPESHSTRIAIGRAGNVIGGGDWSTNRLVPDLIRNWSVGKLPQLRNPKATRPWQHVLEPLAGYLQLGANISNIKQGSAFNFGPNSMHSATVLDVARDSAAIWGKDASLAIAESELDTQEAGLLALSSDLAKHSLGWEPRLTLNQTLEWTIGWYKVWHERGLAASARLTRQQISEYLGG